MEMPLFAMAHMYAFSFKDYVESPKRLAGRMPFLYAFRDSFGTGDIFSDTMSTIHGTEYSYQRYEPIMTTSFIMHQHILAEAGLDSDTPMAGAQSTGWMSE